ncbi:uncharacterized protein Z518_11049 [Rhinocladiella mackenziei CBS 650.93]|uniref:Mid2 domain-containing protein n=1 Tax=Rhinocladiella mackenziei CBS 650.93 TaxID=1442369 RepID=A0A0D2FBZ7_9EURO|nr:uncharacterized protein Z518_11049 [Rhinocladiella mackenziei CBS 650.93]KIW99636.1 hypothetical protein Z518_11049 [Rhinocladiella mackenziei CBS 650.93]
MSSGIDTSVTDDGVSTTVIDTTSTSLTTSFSTTVTVTDSTASTSEITTSTPSSTIVSSVSIPPSTTVIEPTSTSSPSVVAVTATITQTPSATEGTTAPSVIVVTSTYSPDTPTSDTAVVSSVITTSSSSPTPSTLSASGSNSGSSGGLSSGAKIAIAVIIPIVVIAAAFLIGFFCWRRRKARKSAEEQRKNEMAEYGFNPNNDPTLVPVGGAYTDNQSEAHEDNSGYRGWGATSSNRKASTTLGSNGRAAAAGVALSESSSQPGGYGVQSSPNGAVDQYSADPVTNGHPESGDGVAALGAGGLAGGLNRNHNGTADIRRGPSNASSAYSTGHQSEASSDTPQMPGPYYQEEVPYNIYNDAAPHHGPYGDGSYGGAGGQPVIRDVQARRNTRIERAPTFPQTQGGIAQNF